MNECDQECRKQQEEWCPHADVLIYLNKILIIKPIVKHRLELKSSLFHDDYFCEPFVENYHDSTD